MRKLKDLYYKIRFYIKYNLSISKLKLVWYAMKSDNFDYCFLLRIEQLKMKEMVEYFKKITWINTDSIIRELKWCISLIDIITEETPITSLDVISDEEYKKLEESDGENNTWMVFGKHYKSTLLKHVNTKNAYRFTDQDWIDRYPDELYKLKAISLYHKIRTYKMETWWD